jgi:predicted ABC-type ATPase
VRFRINPVSVARKRPRIVVLAGPNGAGKTTAAPFLFRQALPIDHFVNPDILAEGLSGFAAEAAALDAARIMLERMRKLAAARKSFAFETTLASRSLAPWLRQCRADGYRVDALFLALPSVSMALARVAERVRLGGHDVPQQTIRRRFALGLRNFFRLYMPLFDEWRFYNNATGTPRLVARGRNEVVTLVRNRVEWGRFRRLAARR